MVEIQQSFAKQLLERREEEEVRLGGERGRRLGQLGEHQRVPHPSPCPSLYRRPRGVHPHLLLGPAQGGRLAPQASPRVRVLVAGPLPSWASRMGPIGAGWCGWP